MNTIIGEKIGMSHLFDEAGFLIPVTIVRCDATTLVGTRNIEKDNYNALIIGYGKMKHPTLPYRGMFRKLSIPPTKVIVEVRVDELKDLKVGDIFTASTFKPGEKVCVTGTSKGKGFQGPIKRWGFSRGPMTHGSKSHRVQGSIGASADPSRVWKGKKMAGKTGAKKVTVKNLSVVKVDEKENMLYIKGAIPGVKKGIVLIRKLTTVNREP